MSSHTPIDPAILYWGTPVVLITTVNPDGTPNICPMSSAFWLGDKGFVGLARYSQTSQNLLRTGTCVLNLPDDTMSDAINGLARTTGSDPVPPRKLSFGYRHVKDKFGVAGLTPVPAERVPPPRIAECPVQMEGELAGTYEPGSVLIFEIKILKTWVVPELRLEGHLNRIDPEAWRPMIMSFQHLFGLKGGKIGKSRLAEIEEELYRGGPKSNGVTVVENSGPVVE